MIIETANVISIYKEPDKGSGVAQIGGKVPVDLGFIKKQMS